MRVGGFDRKHSSQRIMSASENPCGSEGSIGPSKGRRMFSLSLGNSSSKYFDYTTTRIIQGEIMFSRTAIVRHLIATLIVTTAFALSGCAALQPVDANEPRSN